MNARNRKLLAVLAVLGVAFLGWKILLPSEPVYQGKPLSAWAQQYGSNHWGGSDRAASVEAEIAVRQIGSQGIPFLLDQMRASDPIWKRTLCVFLPQRWESRLPLKDRSADIRRVGAHGLAALGTNASAAVPALIEIATRHPDPDGRYLAVFTLRTLYSAAEPAIPFFIQCLTNQSATIRDEAAMGLGNVQRQPEIAVPALISYLDHNRTSSTPNTAWEITDALAAVAKYGSNARPAVPVLQVLLLHPKTEVREAVTNWLPMIDPEAAARAGVQRPR